MSEFESGISPDLDTIQVVAKSIAPYVLRTPTVKWPVPQNGGGPEFELFVKLELMQYTGSFKARGAINTIMSLIKAYQTADSFPGVTAFSAGNHAIATAYAAKTLGVSAKVVMPRSANAFRVERCKAYGAELVFGDSISDSLGIMQRIQKEEGRFLVHPFEGVHTVEGTATVGLELCEDIPELDVVLVPVGGGGLIAGIAAAVKQMQPRCIVIGVEPEGANGMQQSLAAGFPAASVTVNTIADSLGPPMHAPWTFNLIQQHVDEVISVSDDDMRAAMRQFFSDMKLAVEPACGATLAALNTSLASRFAGKRVAIIGCGSNIDQATYLQILGG
jgi:threonine dehydratase